MTASKGADNGCLGELMIRHRGLVFNELRRWNIRRCDVDDVAMVEMPYPYKLLVQELYSMGVVVRHQVEDAAPPPSEL